MRENSGPPSWRDPGREFDVIVKIIVAHDAVICPAAVVSSFWYRRFCGGCENIGNKTFVPSFYRQVHVPFILVAPVPVQHICIIFPGTSSIPLHHKRH